MNSVFSLFFVLLAVIGLGAMTTALLHPHPAQTRLIRALCWPSTRPTDRLAMPLGSMLFCLGAALSSSTWLPFSARLALVLLGAASAIVFGLRRGEA